jgi:hypothetical protein
LAKWPSRNQAPRPATAAQIKMRQSQSWHQERNCMGGNFTRA